MPPQAQKYVIALIASAAITFGLAVYSWLRREVKGATVLSILLFVVTEWTIIGALKWASNDLQQEIALTRWGFIGGTTTPILLFIFILVYLNKDTFLTPVNIALLFLIPVATIILLWTNDYHHLIWASAKLEYVQEGIANLVPSYNFFYWIQITYGYGVMAIGLGFLINAYFRSSTLYRKQIGTLLLGFLAPWGAHIFHLFTHIDLTHFAFPVTGVTIMWNLFQHQLFDVVPIAQDTVIEKLQDGIFVLSNANIITDLNPSAENIIGKPKEETIGQALYDVFPQFKNMSNIAQGTWEVALGQNGGTNYYDVKMSPIRDEENLPIGNVLVMRDISARKEMEKKITLARDEAVANSNTKTYLLNNVTSDIQKPLGAILDQSEMLKADALNNGTPKQKEVLSNMLESAENLLNFVNKLLHQAQLETGRIKLHYSPVLTEDVLAEIQSLARPLMQDKPLTLTATVFPSMPVIIQIDLYWLKQIIANLVSNAVKYTKEGGIEISLKPQDKNFWNICVSDTGRGIPKEAYEKIFEPFERDESSLVRERDSGSGLGLAIVKQLASLMGGEVTLESELDIGSTFTISLPFVPVQD